MQISKFIITLISIMVISQPAFAKRDKRRGLNFGTTVRLMSANDRNHATGGSEFNTQTKSDTQLVNPYVGYSTGSLNFGLMFSSETTSSVTTEVSSESGIERTRKSALSSKGTSLFARFLFGKIFFFEAGAGIYKQNLEINFEEKNLTGDGTFTGNQDTQKFDGVGPGYNLGGGMELAMGGGFYFSSAYQVRIIQQRDFKGSDLGPKRSNEQKRELLFGISHYHK